ncbi:MAG: hypothetical protein ACXACY_30090 [Candidatus Hodarchaeales archaeon]
MVDIPMSASREFGYEFLEQIIEWIRSYFNPEEVFENDKLISWVSDNVKEVSGYFDPQDIFDGAQLDNWALDNGYVEEEK